MNEIDLARELIQSTSQNLDLSKEQIGQFHQCPEQVHRWLYDSFGPNALKREIAVGNTALLQLVKLTIKYLYETHGYSEETLTKMYFGD